MKSKNNSDTIKTKKSEDKISEISLGDIFEQVNYNTTFSYELTLEILSSLKIKYLNNEWKLIKTNHFNLMEFIHYIIVNTITKIQKPKISRVEDLFTLNSNMVSMFIEPFNITESEIEWLNKYFSGIDTNPYETEVILPQNSLKNYSLNVKRNLENNSSNLEFIKSLIEFKEQNQGVK